MMENQDLQIIQNQINLYFDNELGQEDREHLMQKIGSDPMYSQAYNKERIIRDYIKSHAKRPNVSADLIKSIKDKIKVL
jgi:DNA integrity scanning protein DisA with diadenylate cyclase activity